MTAYSRMAIILLGATLVFSGCTSSPASTIEEAQETTEQEQSPETEAEEAPASAERVTPEDAEPGAAEIEEKLGAFTASLSSGVPPSAAIEAYSSLVGILKPAELSLEFQKLEQQLNQWSHRYTDRLYSERGLESIVPALNAAVSFPEESIDLGKIADVDIRLEVEEMLDSGMRFVWLEGSPYVIVDYNALLAYTDTVTESTRGYVELMAMESNEVSVRDAALVIPWDELGKRLNKAEEVLRTCERSGSMLAKSVHMRYEEYFTMYTLGLSNTPVVDWDTYAVQQDVLDSYNRYLMTYGDTVTATQLAGYLDLLKQHDHHIPYEDQEAFSAFMSALEDLREQAIEEIYDH